MTGIGPEFLKLLRGIEWDTLTARDAVDLRAALKEAMDHSNEWFLKLTEDFRGTPRNNVLSDLVPDEPPPAKVESGRPQTQASHPREPTSGARMKRKRGRPPKVRPAPNPIAIGGANAATGEGPKPAQIFENSYVSKDGPRADVPATLPVDHPRRNLLRESSVTPEDDAQDFQTVEKALATGRGVKDIFQVR